MTAFGETGGALGAPSTQYPVWQPSLFLACLRRGFVRRTKAAHAQILFEVPAYSHSIKSGWRTCALMNISFPEDGTMHLPLALSSSAPTVGDHLENLVLLGCGLFIFVIALALCSFLFDKLSKARSASAGWLERRAARRRRRTCLKKYYPPVRSSHLRIVPPTDDLLARKALRRNAESHQTGVAPSTKAAPALRLVKPPERVKKA